MSIIKVRKQDNWAGSYRLEYDGKYITLFGRDKEYPVFNIMGGGEQCPDEYEEMVLLPVVEEIRNATPEIVAEDGKYIYIET